MREIMVGEEERAEGTSIVARNSRQVGQQYRIVRFRGRAMVQVPEPYAHFVPLHRERFNEIAYPILGGVSRARVSDVLAFIASTAEDLSAHDKYLLFGMESGDHQIWDMEKLAFTTEVTDDQTIWRSPLPPVDDEEPVEFVLSLAGGDMELYGDIMQSLAPLVMHRKPDGVVWWVGDGANGKSTLMDAIYKIFPGQLSSINVKRLTDGRDTPSLNGTLGNVVKESSEGRIDDTEIYKSLGTHEAFRVHKFHSQDDVEIQGNLHHIFSANTIPTFNDKGFSARRRTFIVPFTQRFESDPLFEQTTFTPYMFGRLIMEMCRYAQLLRKQGYRYRWSATTLGAKAKYDTEANSAEEYARSIIAEGVVGFESFTPLKMDYDNWCSAEGQVPLGTNNLRRALVSLGFERLSSRDKNGLVSKRYRLPSVNDKDLTTFSLGRPGMYTARGFTPAPLPEAEVPTKPPSIFDRGEW